MDKIEQFINLALTITSAAPGITGGIMAVLALLPKSAPQEWTEEKVRAKVEEYRAMDDAMKAEFDKRRTDVMPVESDENNPEE